MDTPAVTVFVPAYNSAAYITETLQSLLGQTHADFELLVIDDGSDDGTDSILAAWAKRDPRLRIVTHDENRGRPTTRNEGIDLARGRFLALMDADDYCPPYRLAHQLAFLEAHPDVDVVSGLWARVDEQGRVIAGDRKRRQRFSSREIAARMLFDCPIHQPTVMARTAVMRAYRYNETFPVAQDHELWARMIRRHRFAVLPEVLLHYRQHRQQATASIERISQARQRIQSRELDELGMHGTEQDVERHDHLFHFKGRALFEAQSGRPLDLDFVLWAFDWMARLVQANASCRRYPEPEFSNLVAARGLFLSRKAAGGAAGLRALSVLAGSALKRPLARALLTGNAAPF